VLGGCKIGSEDSHSSRFFRFFITGYELATSHSVQDRIEVKVGIGSDALFFIRRLFWRLVKYWALWLLSASTSFLLSGDLLFIIVRLLFS